MISHRFILVLIISYRFILVLIISHRFIPPLIISHRFILVLIISYRFILILIISHRFTFILIISYRFTYCCIKLTANYVFKTCIFGFAVFCCIIKMADLYINLLLINIARLYISCNICLLWIIIIIISDCRVPVML